MIFSFQGCCYLSLDDNFSFSTQSGETPLHKAAGAGHHETCQWLFQHGASVDVQDKVRENPYQEYALCKLKSNMCVRYLESEVGMFMWMKCVLIM